MTTAPLPDGLTLLERGWLSANNIVLHGAPGEGATVVDTGHSVHAAQTVALVAHALGDEPLARIVNTHLHSDHCGGNAALQAAHGASLWIPPGQADAVTRWDLDDLTYRITGQRCDRFRHDGVLRPGEVLRVGRRCWDVLAAPGHDPASIMLFDAEAGVLVSADALWHNGFGVVFPELDGIDAFDEVAAVLDLIGQLDVRLVIPGHGGAFTDVGPALQRARLRLAKFVANPAMHARHAAKVLLKYHLMEVGWQALEDLLDWVEHTPLVVTTLERAGFTGSRRASGELLLAELVALGALRIEEGIVRDVA
ncbi:MBL fold metallo-hydrolase [uncultured Sphaerotilus sp.]|uniref:MBL fold metallo-hydrolase n=1 Tax=uncultured Sphaerotilus sp. TaxID=474984 RepID=UPI0030CA4F49